MTRCHPEANRLEALRTGGTVKTRIADSIPHTDGEIIEDKTVVGGLDLATVRKQNQDKHVEICLQRD